ncbi:toprim domain-containing protein [Mycoplasmatota bacterium WC44]
MNKILENYLRVVTDYNGNENKNFTCPICGDDYEQAKITGYKIRCFGSCNKSYSLIELAALINQGEEAGIRHIEESLGLKINKDVVLKRFLKECSNEFNIKSANTLSVEQYLNNRFVDAGVIDRFGIGIFTQRVRSLFNELELEMIGVLNHCKLAEGTCIVHPINDCGKDTSLIFQVYNGSTWEYRKPKGKGYYMFDEGIEEVYLTEGIYDYYSLKAIGLNAYCLFGVSLPNMVKERLIGAKKVITAFDNDEAGKELTRKVASVYKGNLFKVQLKDHKDMNDLHIKLGIEKFENYVRSNQISVSKGNKLKGAKVVTKKSESTDNKGFVKAIIDKLDVFEDEVLGLYMKYQVGEVIKYTPIKSNDFRNFLVLSFQQMYRDDMSEKELKEALLNIEPNLELKKIPIKFSNRIAFQDDEIHVDLCRDDLKTVLINKDGWKLSDDFNPRFIKRAHQSEQVIPNDKFIKGSLKSLLKLFPNLTENEIIMLIAVITTAFIEEIPKPILAINGGRGSAKSTLMRVVQQIIDPSKLPSLNQPRTEKDLTEQLEKMYFVYYDNLDGVKPWFIRGITVAATGGGSLRRKLYTDNQSVIFRYVRNVGISSIALIGLGFP